MCFLFLLKYQHHNWTRLEQPVNWCSPPSFKTSVPFFYHGLTEIFWLFSIVLIISRRIYFGWLKCTPLEIYKEGGHILRLKQHGLSFLFSILKCDWVLSRALHHFWVNRSNEPMPSGQWCSTQPCGIRVTIIWESGFYILWITGSGQSFWMKPMSIATMSFYLL